MHSMTAQSKAKTPKPRRDVRPLAVVILVLLVVLIGGLLQWRPMDSGITEQGIIEPPTLAPSLALEQAQHPSFKRFGVPTAQEAQEPEVAWIAAPAPIDPHQDPSGHMRQARIQEAQVRFEQAKLMLHAERFDEAIVALNRVLTLVPNSADAYVNLGYALIGKEDFEAAYSAFDQATDLNPAQGNAYYGAAIALEGLGDLEKALGGMRSFLHLTDKGPGQIHVARARSAIWEWESLLERGPWGPTKGIPPGFIEEELQRNDKGVGIKMPIKGTEDENGLFQYEIKYGEKYELFDR
jgi:tetratricopeptide (TPR) repeat protein